MTLLAQVLGILLLAGVISHFAVAGPSGGRLSLASALALVAVTITGLTFVTGVLGQARGLIDAHAANREPSLEASNFAASGSFYAINRPFLALADERIPPFARVYLACDPVCPEFEYIAFRLGPRVFVSRPAQADWAIYYRVDPKARPFARSWNLSYAGSTFAFGKRPAS